jgi:hypothetical protein
VHGSVRNPLRGPFLVSIPDVLGLTLSLLLSFAPEVSAPEDGKRFDPPPIEHGYDLRETWDDTWRRFQDRHGRPDIHGPLLQPSPELQSPEYELTLAVASQPTFLERDWNRRTRGARVFIHSDNEFVFFNGMRLKERIPMGKVAALGLRYDRFEARGIRSSLAQLVFAFPDIRGTGAFVEIRPIARLEKPDLDLELAVGWARPDFMRLQARVFSFDTFNNASDALAQNRDVPQELRVVQRNPSFGLSAEAELHVLPSLRAQLFGGFVLPSVEAFVYLDPEILDIWRRQRARLGGGGLEWAIPRTPLLLGGSATVVATDQHDFDELARVTASAPERETRARAYLLAHLDRDTVHGFFGRLDIELVGSYRLTQLPKHTSEYGSVPRDRSFMGILRTQWMPTRMFGFEIAYLVLDRVAEGGSELADFLTQSNHRMSTRFALAFDPHVRITFGVGWDLDDRANRYDQGGMTLTARW